MLIVLTDSAGAYLANQYTFWHLDLNTILKCLLATSSVVL